MSPVAARNGADDDDEAMAYDPEMDPAETRKIRKQYREVLATQAGKLSNGVFFFDLFDFSSSRVACEHRHGSGSRSHARSQPVGFNVQWR